MKKVIPLIILAAGLFYGFKLFTKKDTNPVSVNAINSLPDSASVSRLNQHVKGVKKCISENSDYNPELAFFVDMKIPSGKHRFFIYDLRNNKVIDQGLVAHGSGSETGVAGKLKFSNTNNSLMTSLGKYYIGKKYDGKFGKAYKLYGLDKTNSNAYERAIVLHKYDDVPYDEQDKPICNSYGCPMVNEKYFKRLEAILDNSDKKIILEIYY